MKQSEDAVLSYIFVMLNSILAIAAIWFALCVLNRHVEAIIASALLPIIPMIYAAAFSVYAAERICPHENIKMYRWAAFEIAMIMIAVTFGQIINFIPARYPYIVFVMDFLAAVYIICLIRGAKHKIGE